MIRDSDVHGTIRRLKEVESVIREALEPLDNTRVEHELTILGGEIAYLEGLSAYTETEITHV